MNIRCNNCQSQFNIPDHKLPKDKDAVLSCPKCQEKIHIPADRGGIMNKTPDNPGSGGWLKAPLQDQPRALVLALEGAFQKSAVTAAGQLGYAVETAAEPAEAVKRMAYHVYPLVVMEDRFDPDGTVVIDHMNTQDMSVRRSICLVLMGQSLKTRDPMTALHASVNCVVGLDNLSQMTAILSAAVRDHTDFIGSTWPP